MVKNKNQLFKMVKKEGTSYEVDVDNFNYRLDSIRLYEIIRGYLKDCIDIIYRSDD